MSKRERPAVSSSSSSSGGDVRWGFTAEERARRVRQGNDAALDLIRSMRKAQPAVCEWLSKETYVLTKVVNIVYMMSLKSQSVRGPLPLVRMAQYMPNTKVRRRGRKRPISLTTSPSSLPPSPCDSTNPPITPRSPFA
jgi:hypothetical protein